MDNLRVIRQRLYDRMIYFNIKPSKKSANEGTLTEESEQSNDTVACDLVESYTVQLLTMSFANFLKESQVNYKDRGVVILYDDTVQSRAYALDCASFLGDIGIKVNFFSEYKPAVLLSYAIRYFGAAGGIRIVGNKSTERCPYRMDIYNESGSRITTREALEVEAELQQSNTVDFRQNKQEVAMLEKENIFAWINGEIENAYLDRLVGLSDKVLLSKTNKTISISTATDSEMTFQLLDKALKQNHFQNIIKISDTRMKEKDTADIHIETNGSELLVTVNKEGNHQVMLSDEMLVDLLTDYMVNHSDKSILPNARIIKTTTVNEKKNNNRRLQPIKTIEVALGFHHICEQIRKFDQTGETFLFGYDKNGGFLIDDFVREKDAIQMAVVICEMAQYYKNRSMTLLDAYETLLNQTTVN